MRIPLLLTLCATLALAQAPAPAPTATIRQVLADQVAAWNRGDIPAFMAGYWNSPQTEFVGAAGITRGWTTVRDHYLRGYPNRAAMGTLAFTGLEINRLCPDAALVTGHFHLARAGAAGQQGVFTLLFRRFPAGWRIIRSTSCPRPQPESPSAPLR